MTSLCSLTVRGPAVAGALSSRGGDPAPQQPAACRLRPCGRPATWVAAAGGRHRRCRRHQQRLARVSAGELPVVRWQHGQCLQLLFIDRSDTVRSRFALGMFERISAWSGCSRSLAGTPCGLDAAEGSSPGLGTQAGLFSLAASWQLRPHLFTSARMRFEPDDIDRFDLLICLDSGVQAGVLRAVSADRPNEPASYVQRICCLSDFLMYCSDAVLLSPGSTSALDRQLRSQVALALPTLRPSAARVAAAATAGGGGSSSGFTGRDAGEVAVPAYMLPTGIPRPPLQGDGSGSADEQWERMALMLAVCCAGFVRYLLDCGPDEQSGYGSDG